MNNLLEKIKATTLRQRLIIGGVFLILIGFGTATIVHHQNVVSEAKNKQEKLESDKKAKLDRHLKADKASKDKADQAAREKARPRLRERFHPDKDRIRGRRLRSGRPCHQLGSRRNPYRT